MFDKENEPKKTKQPSNSDVMLSVLAEFLHIHCTYTGNRFTLLFLLTPDIFFPHNTLYSNLNIPDLTNYCHFDIVDRNLVW